MRMILGLRTDKPEAELYLYNGTDIKAEVRWQAHRELSDTLLRKIEELLSTNGTKLSDLTGIVVYEGPGSFTGLRIGISIANTLAYSLNIPIAGAEGDNWQEVSLKKLVNTESPTVIIPKYGSEAHITKPRK